MEKNPPEDGDSRKAAIVGISDHRFSPVVARFDGGPVRPVLPLSVGRGKFAQLGAKQALGAAGAKAKTQQWRVLSACA